MDYKLLSKLSDETLLILKKEAENNLDDIHNIENVITSKLTNLINICLTLFVLTAGFALKSLNDKDFGILFILSLLTVAVLVFVLFYVQNAIMPKNTTIKGAQPKKLVTNEFIKGDENDSFRILSNRVYRLQGAIDNAIESYTERKVALNFSNKVLSVGLLVIFIIGIILFSLRFCQC